MAPDHGQLAEDVVVVVVGMTVALVVMVWCGVVVVVLVLWKVMFLEEFAMVLGSVGFLVVVAVG